MSIPSQPPPTLKPVSHYLKVALEHDSRDKVIAYWARFAAVQKALTIDKTSPEAKQFVIKLLEWLEVQKKELAGNDAVTIEAAGEAHIENYAIKLFSWADRSDRSGVFNKNVVKAFYTAGILFDILESLRPPLSEEFSTSRKYSKWKAAYIHNCLKNGETPIPGSKDDDDDENEDEDATAENNDQQGAGSSTTGNNFYGFMNPAATTPGGPSQPPQQQHYYPQQPQPPPNLHESGLPPPSRSTAADFYNDYDDESTAHRGGGGAANSYNFHAAQPPAATQTGGGYEAQSPSSSLSVEQIAKAQKFCKWAGSALNFDDVNGAIENLEKALKLLKTGQE